MQLYLLYSDVNNDKILHGCYTKRKLKKLEADMVRVINDLHFGVMNTSESVEEQVRKNIKYFENLKDDECFTKSNIFCWRDMSKKQPITVCIQGFISNEYIGDYYD